LTELNPEVLAKSLVVTAQKLLLEAKCSEVQAFSIMEAREAVERSREEAHAILDAVLDALNELGELAKRMTQR
jgi:hypothetical protein